ncbi:hypothetical protein RND71_007191 [Anisodus tanguticus]|uniref:Uncharacterized protein n=1 Tax=Anisodus tanguticus TaxID=243964 RepID=A0AAE1SLX0_9SOLA|nr:hypothetical protein RND71_007191 [Anisodus tanguticus]
MADIQVNKVNLPNEVDDDDNDECLIKEVEMTVPKTDDPTTPVQTFRMWFLGITSCVLLSFVNQFFWYRIEPLSISSTAVQIAVVPIGHLMAKTITKRVFFEGTGWAFTLNPGPFNVKEHVLITIFANAGAGTVYATHILSAVKLYYKRPLSFFPALLIMITTQILSSLSWLCWLAPKSIFVQQLGSGMRGLGIGALGFDWTTISSYLGSPLASPWFASANVAVGFVLVMYVMTPLTYWYNVYNAKTFPIFSSSLFTQNGTNYNTEGVIDAHFQLDKAAYNQYGKLHLSTFLAMTYGLGFAGLSATLVHVFLFHGREVWSRFRESCGCLGQEKRPDVHTRLMKKYKQHYIETFQLPWWGVLGAFALALGFTLPIGIITATTNQQPGLNIITEYFLGLIYPGYPVANMLFKVYGYISMVQALSFVYDFKLGHYMKIPPRAMFMAQMLGTFIAIIVYTITAWWLMDTVPDLCDISVLPDDSPWQCPQDRVFYDASVIWGFIGPMRIFGSRGVYINVNWFFAPKGGISHPRSPHTPVRQTVASLMRTLQLCLSGGLDAGTAFIAVLLFIALQSKDISVDWWGNNVDGCQQDVEFNLIDYGILLPYIQNQRNKSIYYAYSSTEAIWAIYARENQEAVAVELSTQQISDHLPSVFDYAGRGYNRDDLKFYFGTHVEVLKYAMEVGLCADADYPQRDKR